MTGPTSTAHDRSGDIFLITGIGYYPNLGVKDAYVLVEARWQWTQTAVHLSDAIDQDRLNQHVNGYRVEVVEPLQTVRIVMDETEGMAVDLTWEGLFPVVQEQPHIMRQGNRVTLDAQRFAQLGSWAGHIVIDGEEITVDPAGVDRQPRPLVGHPADRRGRTARPARRPAVRGHVVAVRPDGVRGLRDRASSSRRRPTVSARSTTARGSGGTAASSSWAGRG